MSALKKGSTQPAKVRKDASAEIRGPGASLEKLMTPLMDVFESEHSVIIELDLPGISIDDTIITYLNDTVVVEGVKQRRQDEEKVSYLCMEIPYAPFMRSVALHAPVNPHNATASYKNGVLRLILPKISNKRGIAVKIPVTT